MVFPLRLSVSIARHMALNEIRGQRRFPLVLMLEPTFRCNLTCAGCGRIREERAIADRILSPDECLAAVEEAGAPVVSVSGGEPLLHPQIGEIVRRIVGRKRFVYLCSNGIILQESLHRIEPSPYLSFVLHLDGLAETHDRIVGRKGVFDLAIAGIKAAKQAGFQVRTNTTFYKGVSSSELGELFSLLTGLGVDGMMVAPAFGYRSVDSDIFLTPQEAAKVFEPVYEQRHRFRFYHTSTYIEFLAGKRRLNCTPWSTPTRNPRGWKMPCYLITDGYCDSFQELLSKTRWEKYGVGNDPRCANCMVHSGFEASAIEAMLKGLIGRWRTGAVGFFANRKKVGGQKC